MEMSKPYKPIFICFIDMIFSITFIIASILFFWSRLDISTRTDEEWRNFMPRRVIIYDCLFLTKFFADVFYLRICFSKKELNRSSSTSSLFWFRVCYNFLAFGFIMLSFRYKVDFVRAQGVDATQVNLTVADFWRITGLIIPMFALETAIYMFCVKEAKDRAVYQKFSTWKKGGPNPAEDKKKRE